MVVFASLNGRVQAKKGTHFMECIWWTIACIDIHIGNWKSNAFHIHIEPYAVYFSLFIAHSIVCLHLKLFVVSLPLSV